jgi:peptidoglycan/xylan/chitin deacetylase (PgdA/CDA1 family)
LDLSLGVDPVIGVIPKVDQSAVVEEFFELFKTPWEFYEQGRSYDVVVATVEDIPEVDTRLLLVYGCETKSIDARNGITVRSRHRGGSLDYQGIALPIYGDIASFEEECKGIPCLAATNGIAGLRIVSSAGPTVLRLGHDLFQEVQFLLSAGQPIEHARIPTLDIHIGLLRSWILNEGIPLLEIPPAPVGHSFAVCLTHDIDFVGIRNHKFDHTMWGFLYRSTVGAVRNLFRRRISISRLLDIWRAAASLPFVYLGWAKDFWSPFEWYLRVEKDLAATYFLIPFKRLMGEQVPGKHAARRATAYDVGDIQRWATTLCREGCELGVHGIDAWHSVEKGRAELARIALITGESAIGIRIHWLLYNSNSASVLEESGYAYDSTAGYNETIGYRCGTTQVFRPQGAETLLELPLHIQDGALFYHNRLNLSEPEAEKRCKDLIENAGQFGGVLTVLWHDRSHGPERFWGDFYISLVDVLKSSDAWFATATQAVSWFRKRRDVRFERLGIADGVRAFPSKEGEEALPPLCLRVYQPPIGHDAQPAGEATCAFNDIPWNTKTIVGFDSSLHRISEQPLGMSVLEIC